MKGKNHLTAHALMLLLALAFAVFSGNLEAILSSFSDAFARQYPLVLGIGLALYFIGAILPDSDSNDGRSRIFYGPFFFIGWLARMMELPLALLLGRKVRHRGSLHTIIGILFSSLIVVLFISGIYFSVFRSSFTPAYPLFWFICLSLSQFLHLLEDLHFRLK